MFPIEKTVALCNFIWGQSSTPGIGLRRLAFAVALVFILIVGGGLFLYGPVNFFSPSPALAAPCTVTVLSGNVESHSPDEDEWAKMLPPEIFARMAYLSCLRGGYDYAFPLVDAIHKGVNEYLSIASEGIVKAQVNLSLLPSQEVVEESDTRIGRRVIELLKEEVAEGKDEEVGPSPSPSAKTPEDIAKTRKEIEDKYRRPADESH